MSGLRRYSNEEKLKIVGLYEEGKKYTEIARIISSASNSRTTATGVGKFLARFKQQQHITNAGMYRPKRSPTPRYHSKPLAFIDKQVNLDREISAAQLQRMLKKEFNICPSVSTISRARRQLGWVWTATQYCQLVRVENRRKRVRFCLNVCKQRDTFDDVIFTDESTIKCEKTTSRCFRKKNERPQLKPKPKHPFQVYLTNSPIIYINHWCYDYGNESGYY